MQTRTIFKYAYMHNENIFWRYKNAESSCSLTAGRPTCSQLLSASRQQIPAGSKISSGASGMPRLCPELWAGSDSSGGCYGEEENVVQEAQRQLWFHIRGKFNIGSSHWAVTEGDDVMRCVRIKQTHLRGRKRRRRHSQRQRWDKCGFRGRWVVSLLLAVLRVQLSGVSFIHLQLLFHPKTLKPSALQAPPPLQESKHV